MRRKVYIFDDAAVGMRKLSRSLWSVLRPALGVLAVSVALFVLFYGVTALFVSTDTEKRLRRENKMYEKVYSDLPHKQELLARSVEILQQKDSRLYDEVFHTPVPEVDPVSGLDFLFGADTIPDANIVKYTTRKADALLQTASEVDAAFESIYSHLATKGMVLPPMNNPVGDISYSQIGASVGSKFNPFYKAEVMHHGLDIIVPRGTPVFAPEAGTVSEISRSGKGDGNVVSITHDGGYVTRYLHLGEIFVSQGQKVRRGARIASVGMSGNSYAPHLHYEVLKDGEYRNPADYLFGSVGHENYANMLFMSVNTAQSMD